MSGEKLKLKRTPADAAFSEAIRELYHHECQNCGSVENLQCCHILTRKFGSTRTDPNNAVCLCGTCHANFTQDEFLWADWCIDRWGRAYVDQIRHKARNITVKRNKLYIKDCAAHFRKETERLKLLRLDGQKGKLEPYD